MSTLYVDNLQPNLGSRVMAAGHVVQVVHASFDLQKTDLTNNQTFVNTHIAASITPSSTSSKILILINTVVSVDATITNFRHLVVGRNASGIDATRKTIRSSYQNTAGADVQDFSLNYLDTPSSTASTTYSLMGDAQNQGMAVGGRMSSTTANGFSSITLMEIAQ